MRPNLFVVGAMKCGTTTLYQRLSATPGVQMSPEKEPNFFCTDLQECVDSSLAPEINKKMTASWVKDQDTYDRLFQSAISARWVGEASHTYLYSRVAAERIFAFNSQARIVILLRNPIDRAYSEYLMRKSFGSTKETFSQVILRDH